MVHLTLYAQFKYVPCECIRVSKCLCVSERSSVKLTELLMIGGDLEIS